MPEAQEELLNYYDGDARLLGVAPRTQAKSSGHAVGAVNALILGPRRRVLLQRRPIDKENGGRWDKSVGGHVSAGEDFDTTAVREAGEELFDDGRSPRIRLALDLAELERLEREEALRRLVLIRRVGLQVN